MVHVYILEFVNLEILNQLAYLLNHHQGIASWSVDLEDTENVVRIETPVLSEDSILNFMSTHGIQCQIMDH